MSVIYAAVNATLYAGDCGAFEISTHRNWRGKSEVIYTEAFFEVLRELIDLRPHRCAKCGIADCCKERWDGRPRKFPAIVRLCLIDELRPPNDPFNVAMFCTRCRKAPLGWGTPRRMAERNTA
jgi:hypothetical protein